jgi:streptogramin lyase
LTPVTGLAFDKSHNLWALDDGSNVVMFTRAQLKDLKHDSSPMPGATITSSSFGNLYGCNFDQQGNLWIVDYNTGYLDELSKAQLDAGSADVTPAIVITSPDLDGPNFITFDKAGNAWISSYNNNKIAELSRGQLTSGGSKSATVLLSDDGSGTSISHPGEIAFDKSGDLWVPNTDTVVEFAKGQLSSSGNPAPAVKLSSAIFNGPWGTAFDSKGDLLVMNFNDGTIAKFTPKQLKASGAPVPKVSVTGTAIHNVQITFGPSS